MRRKRPWFGRLDLLTELGEEPLGILVAAGGPVMPRCARPAPRRLGRQVWRTRRRWLHPTSGRRPNGTFLDTRV